MNAVNSAPTHRRGGRGGRGPARCLGWAPGGSRGKGAPPARPGRATVPGAGPRHLRKREGFVTACSYFAAVFRPPFNCMLMVCVELGVIVTDLRASTLPFFLMVIFALPAGRPRSETLLVLPFNVFV